MSALLPTLLNPFGGEIAVAEATGFVTVSSNDGLANIFRRLLKQANELLNFVDGLADYLNWVRAIEPGCFAI